jgi:hypothetical protein
MWLVRTTLIVWMVGTYVEGGPVRKRSVESSRNPEGVFNNMKEFNGKLQARFKTANNEMDKVARSLRENLDKVIYLTKEVNEDHQKTITDAMKTLLDLTKRMNYYRNILYNLADGTVRKTNSLIKHLTLYKETGQTGKRYKTVLTVMKQLLSRSEGILTDAEIEIAKISEEMSQTEANIIFFQATVKAAKLAYENSKNNSAAVLQVGAPIGDILGTITTDLTDGKWNTDAKSSWADFGQALVKSLPAVINLSSVITQIVNTPNLSEDFDRIVDQLTGVLGKIQKESANIEEEKKLVKAWKTEVINIRKDYIDDPLLEPEELDEFLVDDIIEDFANLKEKAQAYIDHIDREYPDVVDAE